MSGDKFQLELGLTYSHGVGALQPYFAALGEGRALARRCESCGHVWFPPHAICPNDGASCSWIELDGTGVVVSATRTWTELPFTSGSSEQIFALIAMTGAENVAFGRLVSESSGDLAGACVRLETAPEPIGHPAQAAIFRVLEEA